MSDQTKPENVRTGFNTWEDVNISFHLVALGVSKNNPLIRVVIGDMDHYHIPLKEFKEQMSSFLANLPKDDK